MAYPSSPAANHIRRLKREYLVESEKAISGKIWTWVRNASPMEEWELIYTEVDTSAQSTLESYHDTMKGYSGTDTWANPRTGTSMTIRIKEFKRSNGAGTRKNYSITLEVQI